MPTTDHEPYPTRTASWSGWCIDPPHLHANSRTIRRRVPYGIRATSSAIGGGARLRQQNEDVEQPAADGGHGCSHISPSSSPQNLLNSGYLLVAPDNTLANRQFLRPRTGIELYRQSDQRKERGRPKENNADPGQGRKL